MLCLLKILLIIVSLILKWSIRAVWGHIKNSKWPPTNSMADVITNPCESNPLCVFNPKYLKDNLFELQAWPSVWLMRV